MPNPETSPSIQQPNIDYSNPHEQTVNTRLLERARQGNVDARHQLEERNLGLVKHIATRYSGLVSEMPAISGDDLIQEGMFGFDHAIDIFDETKGTFVPYAVNWIRNRALRYIDYNASTIRLPADIRNQVRGLKTTVKEFEEAHGRQPNLKELSELTGKPPEIIDDLRRANTLSCMEPLNTVSDEELRGNYVTSLTGTPSLIPGSDEHVDSLTGQDVVANFDTLVPDPNVRDMIAKRFGLFGQEEYTYKELAKARGVTHQAVQNRIKRELARLAEKIEPTQPKSTSKTSK